MFPNTYDSTHVLNANVYYFYYNAYQSAFVNKIYTIQEV